MTVVNDVTTVSPDIVGTSPDSPASDTPPGSLLQRRCHALSGALAELAADTDATRYAHLPAMAIRPFGEGCVVIALRGAFDQHATERLAGLLRDLRHLTTVELVMDLGGLGDCHHRLARALARARGEALAGGAQVALLNAPTSLRPDLGYALGSDPFPPAGRHAPDPTTR